MRSLILAAALAAAGFTGTAQAAITVYTSQTDFSSAVGSAGTDGFDDLPSNPQTSPITRTAGTYGYTATTDSGFRFTSEGTDTDRWLSTAALFDTITFDHFTGGAAALGGLFFTTQFLTGNPTGGDVTLTATDSLGATVSQTIASSSTTSFLGFVSTGTLSNVTLAVTTTPGAGLAFATANNLTLGVAAVPEPATWAMMLVGIGTVGGAARSRRRTTLRYA